MTQNPITSNVNIDSLIVFCEKSRTGHYRIGYDEEGRRFVLIDNENRISTDGQKFESAKGKKIEKSLGHLVDKIKSSLQSQNLSSTEKISLLSSLNLINKKIIKHNKLIDSSWIYSAENFLLKIIGHETLTFKEFDITEFNKFCIDDLNYISTDAEINEILSRLLKNPGTLQNIPKDYFNALFENAVKLGPSEQVVERLAEAMYQSGHSEHLRDLIDLKLSERAVSYAHDTILIGLDNPNKLSASEIEPLIECLRELSEKYKLELPSEIIFKYIKICLNIASVDEKLSAKLFCLLPKIRSNFYQELPDIFSWKTYRVVSTWHLQTINDWYRYWNITGKGYSDLMKGISHFLLNTVFTTLAENKEWIIKYPETRDFFIQNALGFSPIKNDFYNSYALRLEILFNPTLRKSFAITLSEMIEKELVETKNGNITYKSMLLNPLLYIIADDFLNAGYARDYPKVAESILNVISRNDNVISEYARICSGLGLSDSQLKDINKSQDGGLPFYTKLYDIRQYGWLTDDKETVSLLLKQIALNNLNTVEEKALRLLFSDPISKYTKFKDEDLLNIIIYMDKWESSLIHREASPLNAASDATVIALKEYFEKNSNLKQKYPNAFSGLGKVSSK